MKKNFMSRKFILAVAAMLASFASSIAGLATQNETVAIIGIVCGVLSGGLYAFAEAYVDAKAVDK